MSKYLCVQFGVCPRADSGECFEVGGDFKCGRSPEDPECASKLEAVQARRRLPSGVKVALIGILVAVIGVAVFLMLGETAPVQTSTLTSEQLLKEVWPWLSD